MVQVLRDEDGVFHRSSVDAVGRLLEVIGKLVEATPSLVAEFLRHVMQAL